MRLDHSAVHTTRAFIKFLLRVCCVVLMAIAIVLIGNRILFGLLANGQINSAWKVWRGAGEHHGIFLGLPMLAVGVGLGFFSTSLSRWIVRPPGRGCAHCGYETLDDEGRCSECGYR